MDELSIKRAERIAEKLLVDKEVFIEALEEFGSYYYLSIQKGLSAEASFAATRVYFKAYGKAILSVADEIRFDPRMEI